MMTKAQRQIRKLERLLSVAEARLAHSDSTRLCHQGLAARYVEDVIQLRSEVINLKRQITLRDGDLIARANKIKALKEALLAEICESARIRAYIDMAQATGHQVPPSLLEVPVDAAVELVTP